MVRSPYFWAFISLLAIFEEFILLDRVWYHLFFLIPIIGFSAILTNKLLGRLFMFRRL